MGILKRARVVLACAALAAPFTAAAVAMPAPALASAVSPHHAAGPDTTGCIGGKAVESAELNPGAHGMILLCYNINNRHTWGKVYTTGLPVCFDPPNGAGCGTAQVVNTQGVAASCSIPQNATSCTTGEIDDAGITSTASAVVIVQVCGGRVCKTASGVTNPY